MNWTYLLLDVAAILGPLALSFDSRVHYFSKWKAVFIASLIVAIPFLIWDYFFTLHGIWGFNSDYISGISVGNLPIEEILFFIVVPFSCTFIYECCKYYLRNWNSRNLDVVLQITLLLYAAFLLFQNPTGLYTSINSTIGILVILFWMFRQKSVQYVGITFLLSMIPFLIMNGILTGASTKQPIVWYNNFENSALRIHTIPMEDVIYGMTLILSVIFLYEGLLKKWRTSSKK
ncbi:MAG: lycopene cyclase domain-containing protein [Crocinitomicaceae bacterium]|jgi:lycopene cyclase domain-containing protein